MSDFSGMHALCDHVFLCSHSQPVIDLLVTLCAQYHLNPSDYVIELMSSNQKLIKFKPNTPIGSLEAERVVLKPKQNDEINRKVSNVPVVSRPRTVYFNIMRIFCSFFLLLIIALNFIKSINIFCQNHHSHPLNSQIIPRKMCKFNRLSLLQFYYTGKQ